MTIPAISRLNHIIPHYYIPCIIYLLVKPPFCPLLLDHCSHEMIQKLCGPRLFSIFQLLYFRQLVKESHTKSFCTILGVCNKSTPGRLLEKILGFLVAKKHACIIVSSVLTTDFVHLSSIQIMLFLVMQLPTIQVCSFPSSSATLLCFSLTMFGYLHSVREQF